MKKFLAIIMTIFLMAGALSFTAFAEETLPEPAAGTVLRVTAIKGDETVLVGDYTNFEEGWREAIKEARPSRMKFNKYERVIVDLCTDWISAEDGNFTDDKWMQGNSFGFNNDTIYIQDDVKITVNLNGHTIKRVLPDSQSDGEVIYIDEDADVIINNGTITGGKSTNGAGGIHVHDAHLTLNDVHIVGNVADNDDGGGIALYDDAVLVMNGGSFQNNELDGYWAALCYGGAVYADESKATFKGVEFKNNKATSRDAQGVAIYAEDSTVNISECTFEGNGIEDKSNNIYAAQSIIHGIDSTIKVEKTTFTNNGSYFADAFVTPDGFIDNEARPSSIFSLEDTTLTIEKDSKLSNNLPCALIYCIEDSKVYVSDTTFSDNKSVVMLSRARHSDDSYFKNCTFNNNKMAESDVAYMEYTFYVNGEALSFDNCDMGDSTYRELDELMFIDGNNTPKQIAGVRRFGSIFGEGSLTMIVALLALIASGVAIFLTVYYNKKKTAPVAADNEEETENEE